MALGILLAMALIGVIVTRFLPETGLVKPNASTREAVADLVEVETALDRSAEFQPFSEALRVAFATFRHSPVRNPADGQVLHIVEESLDRYAAMREAWQTVLEGQWDDAVDGDRAYWSAAHPALELPAGDEPLTPEDVMTAAREQAAALAQEAAAELAR